MAGSLALRLVTAFWFLGQFWGKTAVGKGLVGSWPKSGLAADQGTGATWGRAAQLHPQHPNPIPYTSNTLRWGRQLPAHSLPPTSTYRTTSSEFWLPTQNTHHHATLGVLTGLTHPQFSHITGHPHTFGCWSSLIHESEDGARMLHVEGGWGQGYALPHAAAAQGSVRLSIQAPSILRAGGCTELPGGRCSAHGEEAGRQRLILSSRSHHGYGHHPVVPPRTPVEERGASLAPKGLSPAFRKAQRPRTTHHQGGKTPRGSAHLHFHPPAAAGHGTGNHQHHQHCRRHTAADEHLPTRGQGHSPAQTKQLRKRAKNTSCTFARCPPRPGRKSGCCILLPLDLLPTA